MSFAFRMAFDQVYRAEVYRHFRERRIMAAIIDKKLPVDAHIEPNREVLRRLEISGSAVTLRSDETRLMTAALGLAAEGWLVSTGSWDQFGATYTQFRAGDRLDVKALKDLR